MRELQAEGEWKKAWDVVMEWNDWLADVGKQEREPQRSAVDVEMHSQAIDVQYQVVREGDDETLPTTVDGEPDYEALGFTSAPAPIDVESSGDREDDD